MLWVTVDSMAHPDYWRRFLYLVKPGTVDFSEYGGALEAIDALVSYDVGIEINTSGWRHQHETQYPIRGFLEVANEAGVKKVTLGSDSHIPDQLGFLLPEAVDLLKDVGFKYVSSFKLRKNCFNPIDSVVRTVKNE